MSLYSLKKDMIKMIELSAEIATYNQMLLHHNNISDKRNYKPNKCDKIIKKVNIIQKEFYDLKYKWFGDFL